ncbi:MAG: DtxR family Mn-dependent transcriptional regulator, partial [Akkermansiaceae bacterium]
MPSSTVENYLKAIWSLQNQGELGELVLIGQVAEKIPVTPGTATTMMNQLLKKGLVDYIPRRGVRLSESGRSAALLVLR